MSYIQEHYKDAVKEIKDSANFFYTTSRVFKCLRGDQLSVLHEEFNRMASTQSREDKKKMAVSLPIAEKINSKLSDLYTREVYRTAKTNQATLEYYIKDMDIDSVLQQANELFNGLKSVLVELYPAPLDKTLPLEERRFRIKGRAIPNDRFWVYSADLMEPNIPEIYIKFMGSCKDLKNKYVNVDLFFAYTDKEWLAFDSAGRIREEYKGDTNWENVLEVAPFVYINKDNISGELIPSPNRDLLQNMVQINGVFTDAVVANYYQSFPIRVLLNANTEGLDIEINPHTILDLKSAPGSSNNPDFKEISATLNTANSIALAKEILTQMLYCYGINAEGAVQADSSGVSIALKSGDVTEVKKKQIECFRPAEKELWKKVSKIHNNLLKRNILDEDAPKEMFDPKFSVDIEFVLPSTEADTIKAVNGTEDEAAIDPNAPAPKEAAAPVIED